MDLVERVERSRWHNLLALATAYRTLYPDAGTATKQLVSGTPVVNDAGCER
jgi:hypothetical protein